MLREANLGQVGIAAGEDGHHPQAGELIAAEQRGDARGTRGLHQELGALEQQALGAQDRLVIDQQDPVDVLERRLEGQLAGGERRPARLGWMRGP